MVVVVAVVVLDVVIAVVVVTVTVDDSSVSCSAIPAAIKYNRSKVNKLKSTLVNSKCWLALHHHCFLS